VALRSEGANGALAWASSSDAFCFAPSTHQQRRALRSKRPAEKHREQLSLLGGRSRETSVSSRGEGSSNVRSAQYGAGTSPATDVSLAPWVSECAERRIEDEERLQSSGGFQQGALAFSLRANLASRRLVVSSRRLWLLLLNPWRCSPCLGEGQAGGLISVHGAAERFCWPLSALPFLPAGLSPAEQPGEPEQDPVLMSVSRTKQAHLLYPPSSRA